MEEFFLSFLRRAGMPASAGLSCNDVLLIAHVDGLIWAYTIYSMIFYI